MLGLSSAGDADAEELAYPVISSMIPFLLTLYAPSEGFAGEKPATAI